jgi:hypothetical protein
MECSKRIFGLQRKLAIGASDDPLEWEADRIADKVLAAPAHAGISNAAPHIRRFAGPPVGETDMVPVSVDRVLMRAGTPMEPGLRQDMEQRFGHDFSRVRVHSDIAAEQSAREMNANAYAVGHHLVFGAGQFAPATPAGLRLLAHELTHVVQQSCGNSPNVLQAQPGPRPRKKPDWEPEIEAETRSAHVDIGKTLSLKFRVSNERGAPKGTVFDWRGIRSDEPEAITMVGFRDHVGAHATLVVKGRAAGVSEVGTTVYFKMPGAQEDYEYSPRVRIEVGPAMAAAQAELAQIEKRHAQGKEVKSSRESAAQQEAVAAAQKTLGKAERAAGTEISLIISKVQADIGKVENARYRGYQDALTHLNLTQFDEKEQAGNVKSFVLSLIGNLTWALSGLIAVTPVGLGATIATGLLAKYGPQVGERMAKKLVPLLVEVDTVRRGRLATAVGVGGAMLAQFANGLPSSGTGGGNVSGPLIQLQKKLNEFNSGLFNALSRDLYSTLLRLIELVPPDRDVDAQQYAGRLESGIRHFLFAGYYESGGATGNQVDPAVIQSDARDQLLRRLVITSGKISGEGLVSTKLDERGLGKLVGPAVTLVGGAKALALVDYELVVEQLQRAARELGIEGMPKVDADQLRKDLAESDKVILSARVADGGVEISNWARAMGQDMAEFEPSGVNPWISEVLSIEIRKKDLKSAKIGKGGAVVYSAERFRIRGRGYLGAQHMEDEYEQIQRGQVALSLIYKI